MGTTLYYIIIGIVFFDFVLERWLDHLNASRFRAKLPEELQGIFDEEKYKKQQEYLLVKHRFGLISSTFSFIILLLMLVLGGFAIVDELSRTWIDHPVGTPLVFFGIIGLASGIINIPFSWYSTFVIEERFGFNKTTPKIFVLDLLKGWLLGALMGGLLLGLITWIYNATQEMFWIYAFILVASFTIFIAMFYSNLIVPLFNKQTPLEEGELKEAIRSFAMKVGFKLDNIFMIDGSKRSTKANAYFSGFGAKKRIVLYDTLINDLTIEELVAVLAHEIGHFKKKHVLRGMVLSLIQTAFIFYIFGRIAASPALGIALGAGQTSFHLALIAFGILYTPISLVLGMGMNVFSRRNEYQADDFAGSNYNHEALISALKKLSANNLSNLTPHPTYVFFHYSHPPLFERLRNLRK